MIFWGRHFVAGFAMVVSGLAGCASGMAQAQPAAGSIGDPWWDEVASVPEAGDPFEKPAAPGQQARQRSAMRRREEAMNILRRNLSVVRATCPSLSLEQRRAIVVAGLHGVEEGSYENEKVALAAQTVENAIAKGVAEVAEPDEAKAYRSEMAARAERRRAAALAVLIEAVDQTAMLDDATRQELASALIKKWQPSWEQAASHAGYKRMTGAKLPPGVAAVVADVLGPEAFNTWQEQLRRQPGS